MAFLLATLRRVLRAVAGRRARRAAARATESYSIVPGEFHHLSVAAGTCPSTLLYPSHVLSVLLEFVDPTCEEGGKLPIPKHYDIGVVRAYMDLLLKGDLPPPPPLTPPARHLAYRREWDDFVRFMGSDPLPYPWTPWLASVFAASRCLGRALMAELLRKLYMGRHGGRGQDEGNAWRGLVRLSGEGQAPDLEYRVDDIDLGQAAFLEGGDGASSSCSKFDPGSLPHSTVDRSGKERHVPWFAGAQAPARFCGVVLAGGALVSLHRTGKTTPGQDYDWFIVHTWACEEGRDRGTMTNDIMATIGQFVDAICAAMEAEFCGTCSIRAALCEDRHLTLMAVRKGSRGKAAKVLQKHQLILRVYPSVAHVPYGFDIDLCGMVYDGHALWCTPGCKRAIVNDFILFDHTTMSTSSIFRYLKYFQRYGVRLLFVGIPHALLQSVMTTCDHAAYTLLSADERLKVPPVFRDTALTMEACPESPLSRLANRPSLPMNETGVLKLLFIASAKDFGRRGGPPGLGLSQLQRTDYGSSHDGIDKRKLKAPGDKRMEGAIRDAVYANATTGTRGTGFKTFTGSFHPVETEPFDLYAELCGSD